MNWAIILNILIFLQYYDFCPKWSSGVDENDATYQEAKLFTETQVAKVKKDTLLCLENKMNLFWENIF